MILITCKIYLNNLLISSTLKLYICPPSFPNLHSNINRTLINETNSSGVQGECYRPEYVVFTWILCLVALTSIVKLYYLIKTFLAIVNVAMYAALLFVYYDVYYFDPNNSRLVDYSSWL